MFFFRLIVSPVIRVLRANCPDESNEGHAHVPLLYTLNNVTRDTDVFKCLFCFVVPVVSAVLSKLNAC
jgi:hypothetical protein